MARRTPTALGSAIGSSSLLSASSTDGSTAVPSIAAMPVVPGLAQAAIRRPASVSYATVAWVGRAAPHVDGTVADPVALQVTAIPRLASISYQRAATVEAEDAPTCGLSWEILAGIGLVESNHGRSGGSGNPHWAGIANPAILGPVLNGQGGFPVVQDTDNGVLDGDQSFDRAVGPMQFLPATWREYNPATSGVERAEPGEHLRCCGGGGSLPLCLRRRPAYTDRPRRRAVRIQPLVRVRHERRHGCAAVRRRHVARGGRCAGSATRAAQRTADGELRDVPGHVAAGIDVADADGRVDHGWRQPPMCRRAPRARRSSGCRRRIPIRPRTRFPIPTSAPTVDSPSDSPPSSDSSDPGSPPSDSTAPDDPSATSPATDSACAVDGRVGIASA